MYNPKVLMKKKRIQLMRAKSFQEFWPLYLDEHRHPVNRFLHVLGTVLGVGVLIYAFAVGPWYLFPLAFPVGYACSWFGHFVVEKNEPATFTRPRWSWMADFKMTFYTLIGRMGREVRKNKPEARPRREAVEQG